MVPGRLKRTRTLDLRARCPKRAEWGALGQRTLLFNRECSQECRSELKPILGFLVNQINRSCSGLMAVALL